MGVTEGRNDARDSPSPQPVFRMDSERSDEPFEMGEGWKGDVRVEKRVCHLLLNRERRKRKEKKRRGGHEDEDQNQLDFRRDLSF